MWKDWNKAKLKNNNKREGGHNTYESFLAGLNFNFIYLKLISVNRLWDKRSKYTTCILLLLFLNSDHRVFFFLIVHTYSTQSAKLNNSEPIQTCLRRFIHIRIVRKNVKLTAFFNCRSNYLLCFFNCVSYTKNHGKTRRIKLPTFINLNGSFLRKPLLRGHSSNQNVTDHKEGW